METSAGSEGSKKISWSQSLSPLEHKLFGSTPSNMSIYQVNMLINTASSGDEAAKRNILRPSILDKGIKRDAVEDARRERVGISSIYFLRERAFDENSFLKDYDLNINVGNLSDRELTEGFDIEIIAERGNPNKFLSKENTSLLLEQMTEESKRPKNTIRKLVEAGKIKVSFSNEDVGTVMHFKYNF